MGVSQSPSPNDPSHDAGLGAHEEARENSTSDMTSSQEDKLHHKEHQGLGEDAYVSEESYQKALKGQAAMKKLGWKQMTVLLIVESVALGSLSLPSAFAAVGMVPGVILTVGIGLLAAYTAWICGQLYNQYPGMDSYVTAGRQLFVPLGPRWASIGQEFFAVFFTILLIFNFSSHTLTGAIMWETLTGGSGLCSLVWIAISAIFLVLLALPPTFNNFSWLGYVDFASIIAAIGITIISTGIAATNQPGGMSSVDWSVWPAPGTTFVSAISAVTNIVFAYTFVVVQFTFQSEMRRPQDINKSIIAVIVVQVIIYTLTGALIYAFVGNEVQSPALLSAPSNTLTRIAFGIALPVIFISGSINGAAISRYLHGRIFANSRHKYINTGPGWLVWILLLVGEGVIAFVISAAIPFFNSLLGLIASIFLSGFCFYIPPLMWVICIRKGSIFARHNLFNTFASLFTFICGLIILGAGTYASADSIKQMYSAGGVRKPFSCPPI
ncbi:unnamed protein product [Sympodiomycopsis kandeliae]